MTESRLSQLESKGTQYDSTRQRDIFDPLSHEHAHCVLVGCGGIGSPTAISLSKLGIPSLTLIDFDRVEAHNIPNQFYDMQAVGELKVDALGSLCEFFGASKVTKVPHDVEKAADYLRGVVVTGLDSMEARETVWDLVKYKTKIELLIDARIGREDVAIYSINPCDIDDIKYYEDTAMYTDKEADEMLGGELSCTERAIIDVSFVVASLITRLVRRHLSSDTIERTISYDQAKLGVASG